MRKAFDAPTQQFSCNISGIKHYRISMNGVFLFTINNVWYKTSQFTSHNQVRSNSQYKMWLFCVFPWVDSSGQLSYVETSRWPERKSSGGQSARGLLSKVRQVFSCWQVWDQCQIQANAKGLDWCRRRKLLYCPGPSLYLGPQGRRWREYRREKLYSTACHEASLHPLHRRSLFT